jgi:hypothetical protein
MDLESRGIDVSHRVWLSGALQDRRAEKCPRQSRLLGIAHQALSLGSVEHGARDDASSAPSSDHRGDAQIFSHPCLIFQVDTAIFGDACAFRQDCANSAAQELQEGYMGVHHSVDDVQDSQRLFVDNETELRRRRCLDHINSSCSSSSEKGISLTDLAFYME